MFLSAIWKRNSTSTHYASLSDRWKTRLQEKTSTIGPQKSSFSLQHRTSAIQIWRSSFSSCSLQWKKWQADKNFYSNGNDDELCYELITAQILEILSFQMLNATFILKYVPRIFWKKLIKSGVTQGKVLGPILYLPYNSDIPTTNDDKRLSWSTPGSFWCSVWKTW